MKFTSYEDICLYPLGFLSIQEIPINLLIATQTIIDQTIINDYKKSILGGKLPTYVLVIFYDRKYYICDGHHRSLAYAELGMFVQCEVFFVDKTYGDLGNKDNYFVQK